MDKEIRDGVHQLYWDIDLNCARATLTCLSELFHIEIGEQTLNAAIGLHGAGGYRAQCGLVEGSLMFIGILYSGKGKNDMEIAEMCFQFAEEFTKQFKSLRCYDLRPNGFTENDPPHACEELTGDAIIFAYRFIKRFL